MRRPARGRGPGRLALALAGALLAWPLPCRALFDKGAMDRMDTEKDLDYEYFSDLKAFSYPLEWDLDWRPSTVSYRANGASLDCCSLLWSQELSARWPIAATAGFSFRLDQRDDKERRLLHYTLEFEKRFVPWLSLFLSGEPAYDKEESDIGAGVAWRPAEGVEASYRRIAVDFPLNRKAGGPEHYSRQPFTDEFRVSAGLGAGRLSLGLGMDQPLRREVWASQRSYSYRETRVDAGYIGPCAGAEARLGYSLEHHHAGDYYSPDPRLISSDYRRLTHRITAAALIDLGPADSLEAGHDLILRAARIDNPHDPGGGIMVRRWEAQPYARWRRRLGPVVTTELAAFLSLGEYRRRYPAHLIPSVFDPIIQAKLGAGVDLTLGPRGKIGFYGAFDLDDLASHPWDGGNARVMFVF